MLCSHVCIMCYVCPILEPSLNAKVAFGCKSYSILLRKSWWMNKNDSLAKSNFSLNISGMGWPKKQNSMGFKKCVCLKIDPFSYLQFSRCINCLSSFSPSKRPFGGNCTLFSDQAILKTFHHDVFPVPRCLFP